MSRGVDLADVFVVCPECGAGAGESHWPGCSLGAVCETHPKPAALYAIIHECRARGWAAVDVPGEGVRPCRPDEPGAFVDLARANFWVQHGEDELHGRDGRSA